MMNLASDDFSALVARLEAFVSLRVDAPADVADVLQDTMERLLRAVATEPSEAPGIETAPGDALGFAIARRAIADHYRRRGRAREVPVPGDEPPDDPNRDADAGEPARVEQILAAWLRGAIAELPEPYRSTLRATELEGRTHAEVAAAEGVSVSAIKSRVSRGRQKLYAALHRCCAIELDGRGRVLDATPRGASGGGCAGC